MCCSCSCCGGVCEEGRLETDGRGGGTADGRGGGGISWESFIVGLPMCLPFDGSIALHPSRAKDTVYVYTYEKSSTSVKMEYGVFNAKRGPSERR